MFILAIFLLFVVLSVISWLLSKYASLYDSVEGWKTTSLVMSLLAFIAIIVIIMVNFGEYSTHLANEEKLIEYNRVEQIYVDREKKLSAEFSLMLLQAYPEHEKEIFEAISISSLDIYLVKYPEIRASETMVHLAGQIRELNDEVYKIQLYREDTERRMRFRQKNPWIFHQFIPKIVE